MTRGKCLARALKALDWGSSKQREGSAEAYWSNLKSLDSTGFCF
jgi:hypothetical protein